MHWKLTYTFWHYFRYLSTTHMITAEGYLDPNWHFLMILHRCNDVISLPIIESGMIRWLSAGTFFFFLLMYFEWDIGNFLHIPWDLISPYSEPGQVTEDEDRHDSPADSGQVEVLSSPARQYADFGYIASRCIFT